MQIPRPTDEDRAYFQSIVPDDPGVEVEPMFGNLGAFVNGNMFLGLFGDQVGVRLPPADAAELLVIEGAGTFGPAERPMGSYVSLPPTMRGDPAAAAWVRRALDAAAALPPKPGKR